MKSLVIEDDLASRIYLERYLGRYGECDAAPDGKEGVERFRSNFTQSNKPYDLVCLDIMMPGLNGHDVLRQIRRIEEQSGVNIGDGAKIVMTSALSDGETIRKSFSGGCEAYLVKPVTEDDLKRELVNLGLISSDIKQ